jgi:putative DNA primase/helicase
MSTSPGADASAPAVADFDANTNASSAPHIISDIKPNGRASGDADGARIGTPEIDVVEARRFLQLLHKDHEQFIFAAGDDNAERVERLRREAKAAGKPPPKTFMQRLGTLEQLLPWLNKKQAEGWGIFVTIQSMRGSKRRKDELDCIRAAFHESDIPGPLPTFKIEPSLVVDTSLHADTITGELLPKHHSYWLIDPEYPMQPESFDAVMACMVEVYASDPDAKDLARVLRLPGSWHLKGEPHRVRIVGGTLAQHKAEELIAAFPRPPEPAKPAKPARPKSMPLTNGAFSTHGLERFIKPLAYISPYERATWRDVGMALHHESNGGVDGFNTWCAWAQGAPDKYDPADSQRVWNSFTTGRGITGGTIFSLAEQGGYAPEKRTRAKRTCTNGGGNGAAPPPPRDPPDEAPQEGSEQPRQRPHIKIEGGGLSRMATEAEEYLLSAGVEIYQRDGKLVRVVKEEVSASDNRKTTAAALREVSDIYMRDQLCRHMNWWKYARREKEWIAVDPPKDVAECILGRAGEWKFPPVNGVISTPTLRPDGTILKELGYDPVTRLILVDPPALPKMPDRPTRDDALAALDLLKALLVEFPFVDETSRSVALSALITPVARGAMDVVPMHTARAHAPSSGKSYLWDIASGIATGQRCHVIAAGRTEEETEKRLAACVLAGYPLFSLDNVNGDLGGDFLCQVIERPIISPRVLGRSEQPRLVNRTTVFATGNNIRVVGDMTRRALITSIDPKVERPELRQFKSNPMKTVLADRGRYVAAVLTIVRAHIAAGYPARIAPMLASFEAWSDMVRSALVWLGEADPVDTLNVARAEDPVLRALYAFLAAWREAFGTGRERSRSTGDIIATADQKRYEYNDIGYVKGGADELKHAELREAIDQIVSGKDRARALGWWLRNQAGRPIDGHRIMRDDANKKLTKWYVERV